MNTKVFTHVNAVYTQRSPPRGEVSLKSFSRALARGQFDHDVGVLLNHFLVPFLVLLRVLGCAFS